jgi:hypothetical protein
MTMTEPAQASDFTAYLDELDGEGAPILGHLAMFSVYESPVTPGQLALWFGELDLDGSYLPGEIRPSDVFEKITGPAGVRRVYSIGESQSKYRRNTDGDKGQTVTLMVRHVSRDSNEIVRHVVREVRDAGAKALAYDSRIATVIFRRDKDPKAAHGAGSLQVLPDADEIGQLGLGERREILRMLDEITDAMRTGRLYLSADRLRAMIRNYIESLNPVRIRSGVYFVGRQHAKTLAALRELVKRFQTKSSLTRIPLPDADEQREMVISAFVSQTDEELRKLSAEIREARAAGVKEDSPTVRGLIAKFRELKATAAEHEKLLGSSIDDAKASMEVVDKQLRKLIGVED